MSSNIEALDPDSKVVVEVIARTEKQRDCVHEVFKDHKGVNQITIFSEKVLDDDGNRKISFLAPTRHKEAVQGALIKNRIPISRLMAS